MSPYVGELRFRPPAARESQANANEDFRIPARDRLTPWPPQACMGRPLWSPGARGQSRDDAVSPSSGLPADCAGAPNLTRVKRRRRPIARRNQAKNNLAADLAALQELSLGALRERWCELYGSACPPRMSRIVLLRALAHRIQEQTLGGLDRATLRRLNRATADLAAGRSPTQPRSKVKPGTRLLREWQGRVHEVIVLESSVQYRGESWPSLSAVAREITGARWSGPRFFGLKRGA